MNIYKHFMLLGKKRKAIVKGRSVAEFDKNVTFLDVPLMSELFYQRLFKKFISHVIAAQYSPLLLL